VVSKFDLLAKSEVDSEGKKEINPTLYQGSGGVLYGLYKYSLLLDKETGKVQPCWLDELIKPAILDNTKLVPNFCIFEDGVKEEYCSFFKSHSVGLAVLEILNLSKRGLKNLDLNKVA
jgi:hypothetical protein